MPVDLNDPKMEGYRPLQYYRDNDCDSSSRIRDRSDFSPVSILEVKRLFSNLSDYTSDAAAAADGVEIGELYRTENTVKVRIA